MQENESDENGIEGTVRAVVFHNEENGYTIFQAELADNPQLITVLGVLPSVVQGEAFEATGNWVNDQRFGRQYKANRILPKPPKTGEAMQQYLSSGMIEGVGKRNAQRIVEMFGEKTFDVIEHESQKLEKVEGIGKKRRLLIKDSWNKQKSVRDIMIFLHGHGLSTGRAKRIHKQYGDNAVTILRQDPYRLIRDLPGVGFKIADEIARKMGQPNDAPRRITAGIQYVIELAARRGHCALPRSELVGEAVKTLSAEHELVEKSLEELVAQERLVCDVVDQQDLVFGSEYWLAEVTVAEIIESFHGRKVAYPDFDPDQEIDQFEKKNGFTLGREQADAVRGAIQNRLFIITGGPGVGKTTILNAILQILTRKKIEAVLCAPTGRAAKRLNESTGREASTIHRLLEFQPDGGFAKNRHFPLEGDLFVVDEASMIDINLMADFLEAIPDTGHLIFVGDVDQLPSVGPGTVLSDLINSGTIPVARLTRIFRQAESSKIVEAAHAINRGTAPGIDNDPDSDFFFIERNDSDSIVATLKQLITERIPRRFHFDPFRDVQVLTPMNRNTLGTISLNRQLQDAINPPHEFRFEVERFGCTYRKGDKVIQTKNNYDNEVFNGDIGQIVEITPEPTKVIVHFEGNREVSYEPADLDELQLAYAITIHKSQGSEFPAVIIPLASEQYILLQRNLIYTGLTRGKKLVILVGEKKALNMAIRNHESSKRWTGLQWRLQNEPSK